MRGTESTGWACPACGYVEHPLADDPEPEADHTQARYWRDIQRLRAEVGRATNGAANLKAKIAGLHRPYGIYDECGCADKSTDAHFATDELVTCLPPDYVICYECCTHHGDQTSECWNVHLHVQGKPYCATAAILDGES